MNKKASFEIASQSIFWLPRIFFLIIFLIVVLTPVGCYSQNKEAQIRKIEQSRADIILIEVKTCLEKGISENLLAICLKEKNVGLTVASNDVSFVINPDRFEKEFCKFKDKYVCKTETSFIKVNNEIKRVIIDMVMKIE